MKKEEVILGMENIEKYLVSIRCITYNQSAYITDALNGFVMQQTDFPFVAVIIDDASTDGEQEVIKAYVDEHFDHSEYSGYGQWTTEDAHWTIARHKENGNCHFVLVLLKKNLFGNPKKNELIKDWMDSKYIALCEGDDYWIDSYKLQKQVDYMEHHSDFVACFHNVRVQHKNQVTLFNALDENHYPSTEDIIKRHWFIATPSLLYRNVSIEYPSWRSEIINGDYLLELLLAREGRFYYMDDVMAVYRQDGQGMSSVLKKDKVDMVDRLIDLLNRMRTYYDEKYASAFDESIENHQKVRANYAKEAYYEQHPLARFFRPKTYKRKIKKWLRKVVQ